MFNIYFQSTHETFRHRLELVDCLLIPPLMHVSIFVVLSALVVESMCNLITEIEFSWSP